MFMGFPLINLGRSRGHVLILSIQDHIDIANECIPSNSATNYPTGKTMLTAFLRTIVANVSKSHHKLQRDSLAHLDPVTRRPIFQELAKNADRVPISSQFRRLAFSTKGYMALTSHQASEEEYLICARSLEARCYTRCDRGVKGNFVLGW